MARQDAVDRANAERLVEILEKHGWPHESLVGKDGAAAADEESVDDRREELGLPPLADYLNRMREAYGLDDAAKAGGGADALES